jgi:capsular polysaccharide biosynthesis protein
MTFYSLSTSFQEAQHRAAIAPRLEPPRHLRGQAAVLASSEVDWNYFHWMFNVVPRAELFRRAGLTPEQVDWYILSAPPEPYQADTLARLGIPQDKIVICDPSQHLTADRLWATGSLRVSGQSSQWAAEFLRELYLDDPPPGRLRLYISRRDSPRHPMVNEPEVETWLVQRGFQPVLPREMSIRDQARLFAQAEVIVAPNGSALANLVFSPSGPKVLELFSPNWLGAYSWEVSSLRGHEYFYLVGRASNEIDELGAFQIPIPELARLLSAAGL